MRVKNRLIICIRTVPMTTYYFALSGLPLPMLLPTFEQTDYPNPRPTAYTAEVILNSITWAAFAVTPIFVLRNSNIV